MLQSLKGIYYRFRAYIGQENTHLNREINKKYKKDLLKFKDLHRGERCFIIGNGPSLRPEDLDLLKNEFTFASNRIFYMFNKSEWRPTYYCAQDADVFADICDTIPNVAKEVRHMFFVNYCKKYLDSISYSSKKISYFYARLTAAHKQRRFSKDISRYIDGGSTITYAMMQIAVYMGFKEIYLIGVDHNYSAASFKDNAMSAEDVKSSYFAGMPANIKLSKPGTDQSTISYIEARMVADKNDFTIYNATRGGKLEIFKRVDFDSLF